MTTELKPCPLTLALLSAADEIEGCGGGNEAEIMRLAATRIMKQRQELESARAVPVVPELVRYRPSNFMMVPNNKGEYVRYDQAAAIIANLTKRLKNTEAAMDSVINEHIETTIRAETAEAKLAQIKAQEPIAWHTEDETTDRSATTYSKVVAERWKAKGWPITPLYAAPVASEAETIERLREVAKKVIARWDSPHWKVTAPTADVMNELRSTLSEKEPS